MMIFCPVQSSRLRARIIMWIARERILPGSTEHVDKQQQKEIAEISLIECKTELGVHHHMQITAVVILLPTLSYIALPGWRRCHMAGSGQESGSRERDERYIARSTYYCTSATPSINNPSLPTVRAYVVAIFIWLYGTRLTLRHRPWYCHCNSFRRPIRACCGNVHLAL